MSFSSRVKDQLCEITDKRERVNMAEISALLRFFDGGARFVSENAAVCACLQMLCESLNRVFPIDVNDDLREYWVTVDDEMYDAASAFRCEADDEKRAFLRGAYLASGTMNNPEKGYHFEISSKNEEAVFELYNICYGFDLSPKLTFRKDSQVLYLKSVSGIIDALNLMGAQEAMWYLWSMRLERSKKNNINRGNNCEVANLDKVATASAKSRAAIEKLFSRGTELDGELAALAHLRLENPEASLSELGGMMSPKMSKSSVARRLQKLIDMAGK